MKNNRVLVAGAGGFIGHHLVKFLKQKGYWVRGVDIIARIAGKKIVKRYNLTKPQGARGRNADITRIKEILGW